MTVNLTMRVSVPGQLHRSVSEISEPVVGVKFTGLLLCYSFKERNVTRQTTALIYISI